MAFISFTGNIGNDSDISYNEKKREETHSEKYSQEDYSKAETKLDKLNKVIAEKEKKLEDLKDDILEQEGILKDLKIDILQRKNVIKDLELQLIQKEVGLKNLEEQILDKYKQKDIYKQEDSIKDNNVNNIKVVDFDIWIDRELEKVYSVVFTDVYKFKIKKEEKVMFKYIYSVIGIDIKGKRDILGIWVFNEESVKCWVDIFDELKDRGVRDILIISIPLISELKKGILSVYPKAKIEFSITDEIRMCNKYVYYKDLKPFNTDLKKIYLASTEEIALKEYDELDRKWRDKYPIALKAWDSNLNSLSLIYKYPEEIRRILYATNTLEKYNNKLKKIIKDTYEMSSNGEISEKIYCEVIGLTYKWKQPIRGWVEVLSKLSMIFKSRVDRQVL